MKILALTLLIITYLFTVLDLKANQARAECGCWDVPYGLEGVATPIDQDTKEWLTLWYNQENY